MASKLSEAAAASIDWAARNGVAFAHRKTEAAIFRRKKTTPMAMVKVGASTILFNKEVARLLVTGDMAGFAAHAQRPPRDLAQGREEGDSKAPPASRANGVVTR